MRALCPVVSLLQPHPPVTCTVYLSGLGEDSEQSLFSLGLRTASAGISSDTHKTVGGEGQKVRCFEGSLVAERSLEETGGDMESALGSLSGLRNTKAHSGT